MAYLSPNCSSHQHSTCAVAVAWVCVHIQSAQLVYLLVAPKFQGDQRLDCLLVACMVLLPV